MLSSVPNIISAFWKKPSPAVFSKKPIPSVRPDLHLMMSGIYQNTFLTQWGTPEFQMGLSRLAGFFKLDFLFMNWGQSDAEEYTACIYEKRNRILFFKNKKLISHFRWDEFKEKWKRPKDEVDSWLTRRPRSSMVTSLSYIN
jgi:hypothetical protein